MSWQNYSFSQEQKAVEQAGDQGAGVESIITEIEGEDPAARTMSDADRELAGALLEFIRKIIRSGNAALTAKRFISICLQMAPDVMGLTQMAAARQLGVTRSALSKVGIQLAEEMSLGHARWRKGEQTRQTFREAQQRAIAAGTHVSFIRKKNRLQKEAAKKQVD